MNKIFIASDHGGYSLKKQIINHFKEMEFIDLGPIDESSVDYSDYSQKLCRDILANPQSKGILICGSGQGMAMQSNRFKGIRAALCWSVETAKLSRDHNDANVLCLGARLLTEDLVYDITKTWLATEFSGGRHLARIKKLDSI
jgi:ribose 5-phosphate isomerase B